MSASPDEGTPGSADGHLPGPGLAAFVVATIAAVIVGAAEFGALSENSTGPLSALQSIISLAFAALTWIVAFPVVWLVVQRFRRPKKEDVRPLK